MAFRPLRSSMHPSMPHLSKVQLWPIRYSCRSAPCRWYCLLLVSSFCTSRWKMDVIDHASVDSAFPPPPLPPLNFTGMSEDAIRAMEEVELAHVQVRLQCLRNVQTLLNASMVQMQQYTNIVTTRRLVHLPDHKKIVIWSCFLSIH